MNRFAGAFLMPREHLVAEAGQSRHGGVTWHEIRRLKRTYGVSAAAMMVRLERVGVLSRAAVEHAFKTYARGWRRDEPEPNGPGESLAAFEAPQRFERLVWRALGEALISPAGTGKMRCLPLNIIEREIRGRVTSDLRCRQ